MRKSKKRSKVIWIMAIIAVAIIFALYIYFTKTGTNKEIIYNEHLSDQVLNVDGAIYTLEDLAFYIAYEENTVEKQAQIYNPADTNQYWNLHVNGEFIRVLAKENVIKMAAHDYIYYEYFLENSLSLSEEEEKLLANDQQDFWNDLTDDQKLRLGVSKEKIYDEMYIVCCAEKYQEYVYASQDVFDYDDYDFDGYAFERIVEEGHSYKTIDEVWSRISMGNVSYTHEIEE